MVPIKSSFFQSIRTMKRPATGVAIDVATFAIKISCVGEPPYVKQMTVATARHAMQSVLTGLDSSPISLLIPAFRRTTPRCVLPSRDEERAEKVAKLCRGLDRDSIRMKDDRADQNDGTGDQNDCHDMRDRVGDHRSIEKILLIPLLLKSEVCTVNAGRDRSIR